MHDRVCVFYSSLALAAARTQFQILTVTVQLAVSEKCTRSPSGPTLISLKDVSASTVKVVSPLPLREDVPPKDGRIPPIKAEAARDPCKWKERESFIHSYFSRR